MTSRHEDYGVRAILAVLGVLAFVGAITIIEWILS